mmetsp:Transcript_17970/g.30558  ORF Transcript_17970/g.30558 Transcript_17970/m.30558 type:complete len:111 (-) Transcript_17970:67-399(-)
MVKHSISAPLKPLAVTDNAVPHRSASERKPRELVIPVTRTRSFGQVIFAGRKKAKKKDEKLEARAAEFFEDYFTKHPLSKSEKAESVVEKRVKRVQRTRGSSRNRYFETR